MSSGEIVSDKMMHQPVEARLIYKEALDAVKELAALFDQPGESQARIVERLDQGSGFFEVNVAVCATVAAGEHVVVYKPSDRLLGILEANRACNRQTDDAA